MTVSLVEALGGPAAVVAAELRPPRAELAGADGIDAWIDTYHAVHRLSRNGTRVFLTDSAVGTEEEDNLRHLMANIGTDVPRDRIVPFLTAKHPLEYCLSYAERAARRLPALVVLGGDERSAPPRCVQHAWQLRQLIQGARAGPRARRLGQSAADPEEQARLPRPEPTSRGVLSDAGRVAPRPRARRARSSGGRAPAASPCRASSASSTTAARTRRRSRRWSSSFRCRRQDCSRVRARASPPTGVRAHDPRAPFDPARGTSTSATCRSAARIKRYSEILALVDKG